MAKPFDNFSEETKNKVFQEIGQIGGDGLQILTCQDQTRLETLFTKILAAATEKFETAAQPTEPNPHAIKRYAMTSTYYCAMVASLLPNPDEVIPELRKMLCDQKLDKTAMTVGQASQGRLRGKPDPEVDLKDALANGNIELEKVINELSKLYESDKGVLGSDGLSSMQTICQSF